MRKIVTGHFMSLDGVVEADDDWQFAYFDDELFEGYDALRDQHPDSPAVAFLDSVATYVVSTTLQDVSWRDATVLGDDLHEQLSRLKQQRPSLRAQLQRPADHRRFRRPALPGHGVAARPRRS
ncbi:MAG TPA: hypothetical protein VFD41_01485 [Actinomycetales bacterium]|nr:hypothetical protein [Actinomycetales bacterium]